jgi:hypothetical protein
MHAVRAAVRAALLVLVAPAIAALAACGGEKPQGGAATQATPPAQPQKLAGTLPALPPGFPTPVISGAIPTFVPSLPDSVTSPTMARPWFDYFSWESFIALNWPADTAGRGNPFLPDSPAVFLNASNSGTVTWGTYKESYELFAQGTSRPSPFDSWQVSEPPCRGVQPRQKVFVMTSKGNSIMEESVEAFSLPLVDQDSNYVRYEIRYNRAQYDTIRGPDGDSTLWLYMATNLAHHEPLQMPWTDSAGRTGALMVKAAWRQMTARDDTTRYLLVHALVLNQDGTCSPQAMGLVGFHIGQKLKSFPEWIWSTFEHVSNVPGPGSVAPYSFNDGDSLPRTPTGWANRPATAALLPKNQRTPTQVTRLNPIPSTPASASTQWVNQLYQTLLANTVWKNYELVITQWPTTPNTFQQFGKGLYPAAAGGPFPVNGATNTSAETYFQSQQDAYAAGGNSCMQCHWGASKADFSWGLLRRAH